MERLAFQMQVMEAKMTAIEGALGKFNADGGELEGMLVRMREAVSGGLDCCGLLVCLVCCCLLCVVCCVASLRAVRRLYLLLVG